MSTPLDLANALASIVGLLGLFKSEAKAGEKQTVDDYLEWLRRHEHQHLADLIRDNSAVSKSLVSLVEGQHEEIMTKLAELDKVLAAVAAHVTGFKAIVASTHTTTILSDQAVSVLRQMNAADASQFLEISLLATGKEYSIFDGSRGEITFQEPRFVEDDLAVLCGMGLLRYEHNGRGDRLFTITRAGAEVGRLER
jgi:hypothetical protein